MTYDYPRCAECGIDRKNRACGTAGDKGPGFCPTVNLSDVVESAAEEYENTGIREFARQASIQEAECYSDRQVGGHPVKPRFVEICEFADKMGYTRLGIAFCAGLSREAHTLVSALRKWGFEAASAVCKVGGFPKETIGLTGEQKVRKHQPENMCNPITQARVLDEAGCDLNIMVGLCVGHDSLFLQHSEAPVTVFAVKDRVMGHNPIAAVHTMGGYSRWMTEKEE